MSSHQLSLTAHPTHKDFQNDGPGTLSVLGPRHDHNHVNFQDIQIPPTTDEILAVRHAPYLPKENINNSETLAKVPMWRKIVQLFARGGRLRSRLRIGRSRHPHHHRDVSTPHDFDSLPECDPACSDRLPCGHLSQERCQPPEYHERLPCMTPCDKIHPCGDRCLKTCSEPCDQCMDPAHQFTTLACGHSVDIKCAGEILVCDRMMEEELLLCGHKHQSRCCDRGKAHHCQDKCGFVLGCGHSCPGVCGDCRAAVGGSHGPCASKCVTEPPGAQVNQPLECEQEEEKEDARWMVKEDGGKPKQNLFEDQFLAAIKSGAKPPGPPSKQPLECEKETGKKDAWWMIKEDGGKPKQNLFEDQFLAAMRRL